MRSAVFCVVTFAVLRSPTLALSPAEVSVFEIQEGGLVKLTVKSSVPIAGTLDKWSATVTFTWPAYDASDSSRQREHRKRYDGRKAKRQGFL